jgi:hypothetical protein
VRPRPPPPTGADWQEQFLIAEAHNNWSGKRYAVAEVSMLRIFYSWLADSCLGDNRMFVLRALNEALLQAAERLGVPREQAEVVQCDRFDTPMDISRFVVETIPTCHALVGDISFINVANEDRTRRTPNPNVMFEVGLATQCLGPGKVILVFNTDSGGTANLPFDVRNHVVLTWSGKDSPAQLARDLREPVQTVFRNYLTLLNHLTLELDRCFGPLLHFLQEFLLKYVEPEHPKFTEKAMALFYPDPRGPILEPQPEFVLQVLNEYQRQFRAPSSSVEGFTEGNLLALILQRLHHDGERLVYRYQDLQGSELFRQMQRIGIEAGHLERLMERVVNRVPDLMVNEIIVDEILRFMRDVVGVRREMARCASMRPSAGSAGAPATVGLEASLEEKDGTGADSG